MSNLLAAVGRGQMLHLEEHITQRKKIYARYVEKLSGINGINFMPEAAKCRSIQWLTAITLSPETGKNFMDVINYMNGRNIECRPVWKPMHRQPCFAGTKYFPHGKDEEESVSDRLFNTGICLPSASAMTEEEQDWVITSLKELLVK